MFVCGRAQRKREVRTQNQKRGTKEKGETTKSRQREQPNLRESMADKFSFKKFLNKVVGFSCHFITIECSLKYEKYLTAS